MTTGFIAATYGNQSTYSGGYNTSSVTVPSQTQAGDLLLVIADGNNGASPSQSGWTNIGGGAGYYRVATSTDAGTVYSFSTAGTLSTFVDVVLAVYRPASGSVLQTAGNSGSLTAPSVTTSSNGETVVCMWLGYNGYGASTTAITPPSGVTGRYGINTINLAVEIGDFLQATAGATPTETATSSNTSSQVAVFTFLGAAAPSAPTLTAPANASYDDVSSGIDLTGTYNSTDGYNQNAYACRIKVSGGTYSYYNASTNALQSTVVWNADSVVPGASFSAPIPSTAVSNGNTYNWSLASQESGANLQGPFASDFTFTSAATPTVSVTYPTGTETSSTAPNVEWTTTPGSGLVQTAYEVIVEHGAYGATPGSGTQDWDSGVVSSAAQIATVGVNLTNGVTYRVFVQATETGGITSQWAYSTFTVSLDTPAAPTVSAIATTDPSTGCPMIQVTVQGHDNLLSALDASFEGGLGTWTAGADTAVADSTAEALDGAYSMSLTATATGDLVAQTASGTSGYAVEPSTEYTALASFRAEATGRSCDVTVTWYTSAGALIASDTSTAATDTDTGWTQASVTVASPSTAAYAQVQVAVTGTTGPLATPAAPTVTPTGTAGTTAYYYKIVGHDAYGTVTSAEGSTTTGNATLSSTNYNALSWTAETGITTWDVWRGTTSGGENVLVASGISTTTYNDEGGGTSGTIPTANTTGEVHYVDEVGIFPGTVTTWTAGGFVGSTKTIITRSDGLQVRNASTANPSPIPTPSQTLVINDYEVFPGVAYTYTAVMQVVESSALTITSPASAASGEATVVSTNWWELDPTDPSTAINAQVTAWQPQNIEQSSAHQVMGQSVMNIIANRMLRQDFTATFEIFAANVYTGIQALLLSQRPVFISSPWGANDCGWFRIGPMPGGMSTGVGQKTKDGQLLASTANAPHRTLQVTAVATIRPPV